MMDDKSLGCLWGLMFGFLACVLTFGLTMTFMTSAIDSELARRELKAYDPKTGQLHWTEKAGGEK